MTRKKKTLSPFEKLIDDLEKAYIGAMEVGNFAAAIKAKELIAKELQKNSPPVKDVSDLDDNDLERLIQHLEKNQERK